MRRRRKPNGRPALPSDDHYWHLDWYGGVRRVPGGRTRVELVLSPVAPKDVPPLGSAPIEGRDFIKPGGQRVVPVSLDLFARSPIGSLFLNGQAVDPIRYLEYSPSDLEFSPEALRSVQTAVALADDSGRPLYPVCGQR
ncbi:MAG TPA: hypothetical protein VJU18_01860 [Vicinamibacteria bacterium]|nr:hypothetical protein [Vicinamibacteria bacterium]